MINTIKLDGQNSYFYNSITEEIIDKYDPDNKDLELVLTLRDSSKLYVEHDSICKIYGGQIIVQYNDDRFIIDDGYRNTLIKSGYIIYKDYDNNNVYDKDKGIELSKNILAAVTDAMKKTIEDEKEYDNCVIYTLDDSAEQQYGIVIENHILGYKYTVRINTVDEIVVKNLRRKDNSLSFYPFDKKMDKYGTLYMSIFAEKINNNTVKNKFAYADLIIKDLIMILGTDYHYTSLPIKNQILYCPEL
jgi:hypothetical protein